MLGCPLSAAVASGEELAQVTDLLADEAYLLSVRTDATGQSARLMLLLHEHAGAHDILSGFLHAHLAKSELTKRGVSVEARRAFTAQPENAASTELAFDVLESSYEAAVGKSSKNEVRDTPLLLSPTAQLYAFYLLDSECSTPPKPRSPSGAP